MMKLYIKEIPRYIYAPRLRLVYMYVRILFIVYTRNIRPSPSVIESLPLINPLDSGFSSGGEPPLTSDSGHGLYYRCPI